MYIFQKKYKLLSDKASQFQLFLAVYRKKRIANDNGNCET